MSTIRQPSLFGDEPARAERDERALRAPFPYFGGKSGVASLVWYAFGDVKQYIEPFCGSAAVLLAAPRVASLEVAGDVNCYIANFWRAVKHQPNAVAAEADYPVSHIDLAARHRWLVEPERVAALAAQLADPEWPGDATIAGWWCWGQCAWIGSGWCDAPSQRERERERESHGKIPRVTHLGCGVQADSVCRERRARSSGGARQDPAYWECGARSAANKFRRWTRVAESRERERERESTQVPHLSSAGHGAQRCSFDGSSIRGWMHELSDRLKRVRLIHGSWERCLNMHYGDKGKAAAIFFDPPYVAYERLYGKQEPVALAVAKWCAERPEVRIALCGHVGDYDLSGWQVVPWSRGRFTYGGGETTDKEAIWFSPACRRVV